MYSYKTTFDGLLFLIRNNFIQSRVLLIGRAVIKNIIKCINYVLLNILFGFGRLIKTNLHEWQSDRVKTKDK